MNSCFDITGDRPAARIQKAIDSVKPRTPEAIVPILLAIVNGERANLGKEPISRELCELADRCAAGHVDYRKKVALYGEDLVLRGESNEFWFI